MKNPHSSVVRRGTSRSNLGVPLVPALSPSVVYHYEDAYQLQSVYDGEAEGLVVSQFEIPPLTIDCKGVRALTSR